MKAIVDGAWTRSLWAGVIVCSVICAQGLLRAQALDPSALPPARGKDLLSAACTQCHVLKPILMLRDGPQGWRNFVHEMVLRGAQLSSEEAETLVAYLAENLGPGKRPVAASAEPKTVSLPPGAGKELVEARCGGCHELGRVVTVNRNRAEWESITHNMVERGAQIKPEEIQPIITYLSAAFGK